MNALLALQIFSCFFMTGVLWLVQILIYPGFRLVPASGLGLFHEFHTRKITWIVAPLMLTELFTAAWLAWERTEPLLIWNLILVLGAWLLTALVSVPLHNRLSHQPEVSIHRLVQTNWPRTALWTLRSGLWLFFLIQNL